jgi:hypothetical protein
MLVAVCCTQVHHEAVGLLRRGLPAEPLPLAAWQPALHRPWLLSGPQLNTLHRELGRSGSCVAPSFAGHCPAATVLDVKGLCWFDTCLSAPNCAAQVFDNPHTRLILLRNPVKRLETGRQVGRV